MGFLGNYSVEKKLGASKANVLTGLEKRSIIRCPTCLTTGSLKKAYPRKHWFGIFESFFLIPIRSVLVKLKTIILRHIG